jgi:hypothetical protein
MPRVARAPRRISRQSNSTASNSSNFFGNGGNAFGNGTSSLTLQQLLNPVPPPGFDYAYLSAIDGNLGIKALIDPATQMRLAAAQHFGGHGRRIGGYGGSGFYILDGGGYYLPPEPEEAEQPPSEEPPQEESQQAPPNEQAEQAPPEPQREAQEPLPDVGQFTLVLRNGTSIQAVAFTRSDDRIIYITTDGSRRTIAMADLDSGATIRLNEERGTPLSFSL